MLKRALAIFVLLVVAIIAIKIAVGIVVGVVTAVLWLVVVAALAAGGIWAWTTLKGGKRKREVEASPAPDIAASHEDRVAAEMDRIAQQLREQGRR